MSDCSLCNELIEQDDVTTQSSCCSTPVHSDCHIKNILNQRFLPNTLCTCGQVLFNNHWESPVPSATPQPEPSDEVQNSAVFKKDFKALKERQKKIGTTRKAFQTTLKTATTAFNQQTHEIIQELKTLKKNTLHDIQASEDYKAYQSAIRGFEASKTRFEKKYNARMFLWDNLRTRVRWRFRPQNMIARKFSIRI